MNKRLSLLTIIVSLLLLAVSCVNQNPTEKESTAIVVQTTYAKGFTIDTVPNYLRVTVYNPWSKEKRILSRYYLGRNDSLSDSIPTDGRFIKIPLAQCAVTSGTHIGFMESLGLLDQIVGICYADRIYNDTIRKRIEKGTIVDLEDPFMINFEKLIALRPNAIMASGYNQQDEYSKRMAQTGIPVIFINEWMESSPLARTEWIKYLAVFFDCSTLANSIFEQVAKSYEELKSQRKEANAGVRKKIMTGENFRGTWYMPGGKNWMSTLFADAGAEYIYASNAEHGSIPLSSEEVLSRFNDATIWVNVNSNSLSELRDIDNKHTFFKAYKDGEVYSNSKMTKGLANNFWESGVMNPHKLLRDYVLILNKIDISDSLPLTYLKKIDKD